MFAKKTIIITGASSGLGRVLATEFAGHRANLVLSARNIDGLQQTERLCRQRGAQAICIPADVTVVADCQNLIEKTVEHFGGIDFFIANAGLSMWAKFEEIRDLRVFERLMATNYFGVVNCTHFALPFLQKSRGMLVAISSIQGTIGVPLHTGYAAAKHAVNGFVNSLRTELDDSVDILLVMPSWLKGSDLRKNALAANGKTMGNLQKKHSSASVSLTDCAGEILAAMRKRKRELIVPSKLRIVPVANQLVPRLVEKIIKKKVIRQHNGA